jgi:hypothetical protein
MKSSKKTEVGIVGHATWKERRIRKWSLDDARIEDDVVSRKQSD